MLERFDLTEKCIHNLLAGERLDKMLTGYYRNNMTFAKGKEVGKGYALTPNDPVPVMKSWRHRKNIFPTEGTGI